MTSIDGRNCQAYCAVDIGIGAIIKETFIVFYQRIFRKRI